MTVFKKETRLGSALKDMNEDLKVIKENRGISIGVTPHVAMHSFANNLDIKS
jgi:site-specific recombinase XerD